MSLTSPTAKHLGPVRLLDEDPELYEAVPVEHRAHAVQECIAPWMTVRRGVWRPAELQLERDTIGLLVLDGLLLRRTEVGGRCSAELLGAGDLLRPWDHHGPDATIPSTIEWRAREKTRIALLTQPVVARLSRFPTLIGALLAKTLERSRRLAVMLAIVHHPRTEVRAHMLLWHLADRWGRVRSNGVHLPLSLSHGDLADLIAAQRPSVTGALASLRDQGLIARTEDGWLLCGDPPGELLELQSVNVG